MLFAARILAPAIRLQAAPRIAVAVSQSVVVMGIVPPVLPVPLDIIGIRISSESLELAMIIRMEQQEDLN
jgi:hypothetical protein